MSKIRKIFIIAYFTAKEILQSKVLLNVVLLGVAISIATMLAYALTYGDTSRVVLNFGIGALSISSLVMAISFGVNLISNEIKNRTVYMIISRPASRSSFILGRLLGLGSILTLNISLLSVFILLVYLGTGGIFKVEIIYTFIFVILESFLLMSIASLFSLISKVTPAVIYSLLLYLMGNVINETQLIGMVQSNPLLKGILGFYHFILPGFYKFNLRDQITYNDPISMAYFLGNGLYGAIYTFAVIFLMIEIFKKKDLT